MYEEMELKSTLVEGIHLFGLKKPSTVHSALLPLLLSRESLITCSITYCLSKHLTYLISYNRNFVNITEVFNFTFILVKNINLFYSRPESPS